MLLLVVFGIKAALFPLFFWLPDAYPTAPSPVTAVFAGLLTKVGVYAIIRTQTLLFPHDARPGTLHPRRWPALTMVVGVLGAIAQSDVKRILSFNIVSHIGYMVMGLGLFTVAGLAAAIFYIVHHIVAKTTLFLTGGLIEHVGGSGRLSRAGRDGADGARRGRAVPRARAQPRRHPAAVGLRRQARAGRGRPRRTRAYVHRGRGLAGEPAHAVLDDEDLVGRLLEPRHRAARGPHRTRSAGSVAPC